MKKQLQSKLRLLKQKLEQYQKMHSTENILRTKAEIKGIQAKLATL